MKKQKAVKKVCLLGITGIFGSGKTKIAKIFSEYGAKVIDADKIASSFLKPQSPAFPKIIKTFGTGILKGKRIQRKKLAATVFGNKRMLNKLNKIIHPLVISEIRRKIRSINCGLIVIDAPLLIESGFYRELDRVIVVKIDKRTQLKRLKRKYPGISVKEISKINKSQLAMTKKLSYADFIIDNNGSVGDTRSQVNKIRRILWKN